MCWIREKYKYCSLSSLIWILQGSCQDMLGTWGSRCIPKRTSVEKTNIWEVETIMREWNLQIIILYLKQNFQKDLHWLAATIKTTDRWREYLWSSCSNGTWQRVRYSGGQSLIEADVLKAGRAVEGRSDKSQFLWTRVDGCLSYLDKRWRHDYQKKASLWKPCEVLDNVLLVYFGSGHLF